MSEHWVEALGNYDPAAHPLHVPHSSEDPGMSVCAGTGLLARFPVRSWLAIAHAVQRAGNQECVERLVRPLLICLGLVHEDVVQGKHLTDNQAWLACCRTYTQMLLSLGCGVTLLMGYVPKGLTLIKDMMEHHTVYLEVFSGPDREKFLAGHQVINGAVVELFFRRMEAGKVVQFSGGTSTTLDRHKVKSWMVCSLL
jgi:hypothetical protein